MKKICIVLIAILIIGLSAGCVSGTDAKTEYLRIHIRANSNSQIDQDVKYKVKDKVVGYLSDKLKDVTDKDQAIEIIENEKIAVNRLIDGLLIKEGFDYSSKINILNEKFPTRVYEDLTLEEGFYDAVIIELGSAEGDNWWCVVYPPLCFSDSNVKYRSLIIDAFNKIIMDFKEEK